uniref:GP3 protein n=1 Tax=Mikumi yellow baboon virus 1 TaxID=1546177 RepID=A0A089FYG4_9NIDO|nr:GP3 protein [Mikumi yellow baboon virus 1]
MQQASLSHCRACFPHFLSAPTLLLVLVYFACTICVLPGARGATSPNASQSCILYSADNNISVRVGKVGTTVNMVNDRSDIIDQLCHLCNCTVSPCSCSRISADLVWVTTHPLQHLLLLVTLLLPNQFHLRRPGTAHVSRAASR